MPQGSRCVHLVTIGEEWSHFMPRGFARHAQAVQKHKRGIVGTHTAVCHAHRAEFRHSEHGCRGPIRDEGAAGPEGAHPQPANATLPRHLSSTVASAAYAGRLIPR